MNGFGRMVFAFGAAQRATASVSSGVLVLQFAEPVNVDVEKIANEMPAYIGAARRDPDGKGLRFALAKSVRPSLKDAGEKLFLDLLPESWKGLPPGLPQDVVDDLARRAREAEEALARNERRKIAEEVRTMSVRVGRTASFTRLIFEMPITVPLSFAKQGDVAVLAFEAAFRIDAARVRAQLGDSVAGFDATMSGPSSRVDLTFPAQSEVHGFREDDTYVIDIIPPPNKQPKSSPEIVDPVRGQGKDGDKPVERPAARVADKTLEPAKAAVRAETRIEPRSESRKDTIADVIEESRAEKPVELGSIRPNITRAGDTIRLAFRFGSRVPAAAFERNGVTTLVFETEQPVEIGLSDPVLTAANASIDGAATPRARIVHIRLQQPRLMRIAADGNAWIVTLGEATIAASQPISPMRAIDENGRTVVSLPFPKVAGVHWLDDPVTGERLAVATGFAPMRSVSKPFRFAEFDVLPSAHGVVVAASADDLAVRAGVDEVVIERGSGLAVTPRTERASPNVGDAPIASVIERTRWTADRGGIPRERIRALERQAADAPRGRRAQARLSLARVLMSNGLISEARGVIEAIVADDASAARDRTIAMLRLIAAIQVNRLGDAKALLVDETLKGDPEAELWTAMIDARAGNWPRAIATFKAAEPIVDGYPDELQATIRQQSARALVEVRDYGAALAELDRIDRIDREWLKPQQNALLRARIDEGLGRPDDALAAYQRIYDGTDRPAAAEAGLRHAKLALADNALPRAAIIERLETVSVIWRGDLVEADTLAALGRLYAEENRWREAFLVARRANELFPAHEAVRTLHDEAGQLFEALFTDGRSEMLTRVEALALFYDFKDFTPIGRRGDDIVRRLAERLVELDLLGNAGELLQHQIDNRLTGIQRSIVAAKLALVYLMDRKPAAALNAIKQTRLPELPYPIKRARALVEARALSDLSRTDLAMDIVSAENGPDVDRLKADILWQGRRWRNAGEIYETILGEAWQGKDALAERQRSDVIRSAIAYSLADETLALDRMRAKYGPKMGASPDARTFTLITSPSAQRAREFREIARAVARADTLIEFMDEYRKRYPDIPPGTPRRAPPARPADLDAPAPVSAQTPAQGARAETAPPGRG